MPRWRRLAKPEAGMGLICSLSAGTFRYEYWFGATQQKKAAKNHRQFVMLLT